jgi:hypothetical protein
MNNIVSGLAASAVVAILWAACTVTTDNGTGAGGSGGSSSGTGGSTGSGGATGTGGTGGTATGTGGVTEAGPSDAAGPTDCEVCGNQMCANDTTACAMDTTGCGANKADFYDCIATSGDIAGCGAMLATQANHTQDGSMVEGGAARADALATCLDSNCSARCAITLMANRKPRR